MTFMGLYLHILATFHRAAGAGHASPPWKHCEGIYFPVTCFCSIKCSEYGVTIIKDRGTTIFLKQRSTLYDISKVYLVDNWIQITDLIFEWHYDGQGLICITSFTNILWNSFLCIICSLRVDLLGGEKKSIGVFIVPWHCCNICWYSPQERPEPLSTKKTPSYGYMDSHYKPETVVRPS